MATTVLYLSTNDVFELHQKLIAEEGGQPGVRHNGRLQDAVLFPFEYGEVSFDDLYTLAALYVKGLTTIRPFEWGNARLAWHLAHLFLGFNDISLSESAYEGLIDRLAANVSIEELSVFIQVHSE